MSIAKPKKVNYLNNKDILKEIQKSKMTFCFVESPDYESPDIILDDVKEINQDTIQKARQSRASRIASEGYAAAIASGDYEKKPKQKEFYVDPDSFAISELVFRVMTFEHIPDEPGRKKTVKTVADGKAKVNFPPFKHYVFDQSGLNLREVVRSHWDGDLSAGSFSCTHGRITNKLGMMFMKLVDRYSQRGNWRGYTYIDEMRGQALMQLAQIGLQFNEAKSENPFAYYTAAVNNSFTRVLNIEKNIQNIRDDILIENGHLPSYSRQIEHENNLREIREAAEFNEDI